MKVNTTQNFNGDSGAEPEPKKLSVCADCGRPLADGTAVLIEGAGKIQLAGPLVGVSVEDIFLLQHVECPK